MPRKTKRAANTSSSSSMAEAEPQLTCDGCTDTITKEEALNCTICKVWLHCYCAGVPRSRFAAISSTFICIPCSLSLNNTVVTELRSEIAVLKAEMGELKTALDSANKKLATVSQAPDPTSAGEAGAEWTAVVKRNPKVRRRERKPTSTSSSKQPSSTSARTGKPPPR